MYENKGNKQSIKAQSFLLVLVILSVYSSESKIQSGFFDGNDVLKVYQKRQLVGVPCTSFIPFNSCI